MAHCLLPIAHCPGTPADCRLLTEHFIAVISNGIAMSLLGRLKEQLDGARVKASPDPADEIRFYTASWCPSCKRIAPHFRKLHRKDSKHLRLVDLSKRNDLRWEQYNIGSVPSLVAYIKGKEIARHRGPLTPFEMEQFIAKHLP